MPVTGAIYRLRKIDLVPVSGSSVMEIWYWFHQVPDSGIL